MVDSKIEVDASLLCLLSAQVVANLESSTTFVVGSANWFEIESDGGERFKGDRE